MTDHTQQTKKGEYYLSEQITEVVRNTLKNLVQKKLLPLPDIYSTEFWHVVHENGYDEIILKMTKPPAVPSQILEGFLEQTDQILDGGKDTVKSFKSDARKQVDSITASLKSLEQKVQHDQELKREIEQLQEYNRALSLYIAQTEKKLMEQADFINGLQKKLSIDHLTGLNNRQALGINLKKEMAKARRYQFPLSVIMIDLDRFREVNDSYGYQIGNNVLQKLADILRNAVREVDGIYRYGGENFVILTPHTNCRDGIALAERLRKRVARHVFAVKQKGHRLTVKASLGVTELNLEDTVDSLLIRTDKALHKAKTSGRNRVVGLCSENSQSNNT
ncbi:MAG: GGDEF domain-containing protein [Thermodesulfobacteriota bacterium]|nr:GGDEF domain-containing protein [Thermodesulfobacteriota bacterium]